MHWVVGNLPVLSINFVLITVGELWALRYPDTHSLLVLQRSEGGNGREAPAALDQTSSHGTRVRSEDARGRPTVIVASERMDDDDGWCALASGELIYVDASLGVETERLITV